MKNRKLIPTLVAVLLIILLFSCFDKDDKGRYQYYDQEGTVSFIFDTQTGKRIAFYPLLEKFIEIDYLNSKVTERAVKK